MVNVSTIEVEKDAKDEESFQNTINVAENVTNSFDFEGAEENIQNKLNGVTNGYGDEHDEHHGANAEPTEDIMMVDISEHSSDSEKAGKNLII